MIDPLFVALQAENQRLRAALRELVELKDLKKRTPVNAIEWHRCQDEYQRRKPLAWQAARRALECSSKSEQHSEPQ